MPKVGNKEFKYNAAKTNQDIEYKAAGGNVAGYYNVGGRVAGCAPATNNPLKKIKN